MQKTLFDYEYYKAHPFMKWVGGKRQLLNYIEKRLPSEIKKTKKIHHYMEPFVGGGALFFHLMSNYKVKRAYLSDINQELILTYHVIEHDHKKLIDRLEELRHEFLGLKEIDRQEYYLNIRSQFNTDLHNFDFENYNEQHIERAAQTIFMNKTAFNGLFRVNKKGEFNAHFGKPKRLNFDIDNIRNVHHIFKNTKIQCASFTESLRERYLGKHSFVYLDPPYRPLENQYPVRYSVHLFDDEDQKQVAQYMQQLTEKNVKVLLSNSDPHNANPHDNFFDDLYSDFIIERVKAKRIINKDGTKRGAINELLIRNYQVDG